MPSTYTQLNSFKYFLGQLTGAVEYTDWISAEG